MILTLEMIDQALKAHRRWQDSGAEADRRGFRPHEMPQDRHVCRDCGKFAVYGGYCEQHAKSRMK